jgi:hypothetical protein
LAESVDQEWAVQVKMAKVVKVRKIAAVTVVQERVASVLLQRFLHQQDHQHK